MSLVQSIIYKEFLLVCGEQKASFTNGIISNNFNKIFKISKDVIIGLTGTIEDNLLLFQDFIERDFSLKLQSNYYLPDVYKRIDLRYKQMELEHNSSSNKKFNVFSLVCGWNGENFEGKTYFIDPEQTKHIGITHIKLDSQRDVKLISCGKDIHFANFMKFKDKYPFNIRGMKNTFKDVLDEGVKFDATINTNANFELIKKPR